MIETFSGIKRDRALASRDAAVPLLELEIGAAEQVVGFGVGGSAGDLLLQSLDGFVDVAGCEEILGRGSGSGVCEQWENRESHE